MLRFKSFFTKNNLTDDQKNSKIEKIQRNVKVALKRWQYVDKAKELKTDKETIRSYVASSLIEYPDSNIFVLREKFLKYKKQNVFEGWRAQEEMRQLKKHINFLLKKEGRKDLHIISNEHSARTPYDMDQINMRASAHRKQIEQPEHKLKSPTLVRDFDLLDDVDNIELEDLNGVEEEAKTAFSTPQSISVASVSSGRSSNSSAFSPSASDFMSPTRPDSNNHASKETVSFHPKNRR